MLRPEHLSPQVNYHYAFRNKSKRKTNVYAHGRSKTRECVLISRVLSRTKVLLKKKRKEKLREICEVKIYLYIFSTTFFSYDNLLLLLTRYRFIRFDI